MSAREVRSPAAAADCPLCAHGDAEPFWRDQRRPYLRCPRCRLVFVPPGHHLNRDAERATYDLHRNDPADAGYRRFLSRLLDPMLARVKPGSRGLDFGCGPGPALAAMFQAAGHEMAQYDPFYRPAPGALEGTTDFITATEVVEHLRRPGEELDRLWRMLAPAGHLGLMTKLVISREAFGRWHYTHDPTHICFFSRTVFEWLAKRWRARVEFIGADVIIFQKSTAHGRPGKEKSIS